MRMKRGWKEVIKNNLLGIVLIVVISMAFVLASDVIIKEGKVIINSNSTGIILGENQNGSFW